MKQYFPDYMSYGLSYSTSSDGGGGAGEISPGDVTYSMVTIGNNTVLYVWTLLLREQILKILITRKKIVTVWWDVS